SGARCTREWATSRAASSMSTPSASRRIDGAAQPLYHVVHEGIPVYGAKRGASMPSTKALTVRLPADLYQTSSELARRRQVSLNTLIQQALAAILKAEGEARLYEAFGELGEDAEEADVEYALPAQWEILRRGDS